MRTSKQFFFILSAFLLNTSLYVNAQKLENPITVSYLKKNISKKSPKLILTPKIEKELKKKLTSDPLIQNYYKYLKIESEQNGFPFYLLIGFVAAFISGLFACKLMIKIVNNSKLIYFAIYCLVIGSIAIFYTLFFI